MRLGLDIDDTVCNTNEVLMKYAHKYNAEHGNKPLLNGNTNHFNEVFGWTDEELNRFFRTNYLQALKEIEPKEGASEVLKELKDRGHEIIFITVRNDRECGGIGEARRITEEWFKKYGIPFDEIHFETYDKASFCTDNNIDVFMDDSERTVRLVHAAGIQTFIAINNFNEAFDDPGITRIHSLSEFLESIKALE